MIREGVFMKSIDELLKEVKHIHFIGIGGSGMCPLAEILNKEGYLITGSDNNESDTNHNYGHGDDGDFFEIESIKSKGSVSHRSFSSYEDLNK